MSNAPLFFLVLFSLAGAVSARAAGDGLGQLVRTDEKGRLVPLPHPVEPSLRNPEHGTQWREAYRSRVDLLIRTSLTQRFSFNSWFENEKYSLGQAMAMALAGNARGIRILSDQDVSAKDWHKETAGIDYYACFVIKHQPRRYFFFGPVLAEDFRRQMAEGAKAWTEKDPLRRPHHLYKKEKNDQGWGPDARNSWVDVRTTDNLTMMRNTAVYLMAEESGNTETARIYRGKFLKFTAAMFRAGNGEWDSENYLGHTLTPLFNTHDFAKDPVIRAGSKAMIDWLAAAMAVKYYRGGSNGPTKRDYNHVQPFGGSLAESAWLMFGAPKDPHEFEYDIIHMATSGWVPPPAIVNLGTNEFDRPRELLNAKPSYQGPQNGDWQSGPEFHETYFIGRTFEFGSLAQGTSPDGGDVNGFKLMADDAKRGVFDLQIGPTTKVELIGSPQYKQGVSGGPNRVAQYRNIALWLVKNGAADWSAVLPDHITVEEKEGVTFLKGDATWIALTPVNLTPFAEDVERTAAVKEKKPGEARWPEHKGLAARGKGGSFCGFAIEIGEAPDFADYAAFQKAVLEKSRLEASAVASGTVAYTAASGASVKMQWGDALADFKVWRNGELHDWTEHGRYVWRETGKAEDGLIFQRWGDAGGVLHVNAGGRSFRGEVAVDGTYTFENR